MSISKTVINRLVEEMLANAQEMDDITVVPNTFDVYLVAEDYQEIQSLFSILREQIEQRLDSELEIKSRATSGNSSEIFLLFKKILGIQSGESKGGKQYKRVEELWDISFKDCDGKINVNGEVYDLKKNQVGIIAHYSTPPSNSLDSQFRTFFTVYSDDAEQRKTFETVFPSAVESAAKMEAGLSDSPFGKEMAQLKYKVKGSTKKFSINKTPVTVGRASEGSEVDLALECSEKISRKHFEIRFNKDSNKFFLVSFGVYGTSVNGQKVPDSVKVVDGATQNLNLETKLPKVARIALAGGEVILDFESKL